MSNDLIREEELLEEEARGLSIQRFHKEHSKATQDGTFGETFLGKHLIKSYLEPVSEGITSWMAEANAGRAGRKFIASRLLQDVEPILAAFLTLKTVINRVGIYQEGNQVTLTALAVQVGSVIHDELRLREFEREHPRLSKRIHSDFDQRELPRHKREEYMRKAFERQDMEWTVWSKTDTLHVGLALLGVFKDVTGDIEIVSLHRRRKETRVVQARLGLLQAVEAATDHCEAMFTQTFPMVVPPSDWSADNLFTGGYLTANIRPYPLVKNARRSHRRKLVDAAQSGALSRSLAAVNALQRTAWAINVPVLDTIEDVYRRNIHCGKLPRADLQQPDPPPRSLEGLDAEHLDVKAYRAYAFRIHEMNRRMIGKRVQAVRAFHMARKFSKYDTIYFPHDLDSRGRAYPKPSGLNPQGPDYVKGLLRFAEGKPLGSSGVYWLAVHGANCWGKDKLPIHERAQWGRDHLVVARRVAEDPKANTEWTRCDNPVQFLAWCLEWAAAHQEGRPEDFVSHIHVDLDATCSGLQHFSAMLRDETGGFHVNMVPNDQRQDVYGAVATVAEGLIDKEADPDKSQIAAAWQRFGVTRSVTKRPVMVKPYSGTRNSCVQYVADAVQERIDAGEALPWPKEDMWSFKLYGATKVWKAIPEVVVAADGAMQWLSKISRLVAKSQPEEKRMEWTTPLGFPVHLAKFDLSSRKVKTRFDGSIFQSRLNEETDRLDPRQMASTVPPSFVHSLDACHLQATVSAAWAAGYDAFAAVHDSFGVHAADVEDFSRIIREQFVAMYSEDVLAGFLESNERFIAEEFQDEIPVLPPQGNLQLEGVLQNEFFFS